MTEKYPIRLLDHNGQPDDNCVSEELAELLVLRGDFRPWNYKGWRAIRRVRPEPQKPKQEDGRSHRPSSPVLTRDDMEALAGLQRLTPYRRSRLKAWGIEPLAKAKSQ